MLAMLPRRLFPLGDLGPWVRKSLSTSLSAGRAEGCGAVLSITSRLNFLENAAPSYQRRPCLRAWGNQLNLYGNSVTLEGSIFSWGHQLWIRCRFRSGKDRGYVRIVSSVLYTTTLLTWGCMKWSLCMEGHFVQFFSGVTALPF